MQTIWDSAQQLIRVILYAVAGGFIARGITDEATAELIIGSILGLLNGAWTIYWNKRNVATVAGLEQAGHTVVAAKVAEGKK